MSSNEWMCCYRNYRYLKLFIHSLLIWRSFWRLWDQIKVNSNSDWEVSFFFFFRNNKVTAVFKFELLRHPCWPPVCSRIAFNHVEHLSRFRLTPGTERPTLWKKTNISPISAEQRYRRSTASHPKWASHKDLAFSQGPRPDHLLPDRMTKRKKKCSKCFIVKVKQREGWRITICLKTSGHVIGHSVNAWQFIGIDCLWQKWPKTTV